MLNDAWKDIESNTRLVSSRGIHPGDLILLWDPFEFVLIVAIVPDAESVSILIVGQHGVETIRLKTTRNLIIRKLRDV